MTRPAEVAEKRCERCGFPIWVVAASPAAIAALSRDGRMRLLWLEPYEFPGGDIKVVGGLGVLTRNDPTGRYEKHRCPGRVITCKYCGQPIRLMTQPPGSPQRMAVLDARPDPNGPVVVVDGLAVRDLEFKYKGLRYRWHTMHRSGDKPSG